MKKSIKINEASNAAIENVTGKQDPAAVSSAATCAGPGHTANAIEASKTKDEVTPKNVFNTRKVAELVGAEATPSGAIPGGIMRAAGQVRYSGSADMVGNDYSATVRGERIVKSGDRPGRQQDYPLQKIDEAPAETYVVPIDTIPMLKDGNSTVGYNGNYRNTHQVSQKGAGGIPCDSDFFRTLDVMEYDSIYFGDGQYNIPIGTEGARARTLHARDYDPSQRAYHEQDFVTNLGNYLPNELRVTFNATGIVTNLEFSADDITPDAVTEDVYRRAGDCFIRSNNINEADRLAMIDKAGDETKDNWSFLGKVLPNSSSTNRIMKEMEASIGDTVAMSVSKLSRALAYQNNKAAKDGMRKIGPMFEMTEALVEGSSVKFTSHDEMNLGTLFNRANVNLANGSSALFIAIKDSTAKYNTKGKMLSLPLSFKQALSTAKQNIGVLKGHQSFIDEFKRQELFGKIDEDGSGISPFFLSDGANVTWSLPLHEMTGVRTSNLGVRNVDNLFTMHYEDQRNEYNIPVYNYFAAGLLDWFNRHGSKIVDLIGSGAEHTLVVPITSTVSSISLWDLIVCDASKDIAIHRRYAMDAVIDYDYKNGYPYSNVFTLSYDDITNLPGVGFKGVEYPLTTVRASLTASTRLLLPETFTPIAAIGGDAGAGANNNTIVAKTMLPWYFNQNAFTPRDGAHGHFWVDDGENMDSMTFFDFRGGVSFGPADRIKAMDPNQLKLSLDRMVTMPNRHAQCTDNANMDCTVWKYAYHEDGIPLVNYNAYYYDATHAETLSIADILKTPRELGLSMIAPAGVVTPLETAAGANYRSLTSSYLTVSGPSIRLKMWRSADHAQDTLFGQVNARSDVAANLKATYITIEATPWSILNRDTQGFRLSASHNGASVYVSPILPIVRAGDRNGVYDNDLGTYRSNELGVNPTADNAYAHVSYASALKLLYMRLQVLPFIINPFDVNTSDLSQVAHGTAEWVATAGTDIFDFMHLFNMCGFRCGEYSGAAYDRNKARIELGLGYVQDPYIVDRL